MYRYIQAYIDIEQMLFKRRPTQYSGSSNIFFLFSSILRVKTVLILEIYTKASDKLQFRFSIHHEKYSR